jgi:hypothetical protein
MTDSVRTRFDRIIGKMANCDTNPARVPSWIEPLAKQRFGEESEQNLILGEYLGAYVGVKESGNIYFFQAGLAFVDSALQFPVYLRYIDLASQELPAVGSGSTLLRLRDKQDLLSSLNIDGGLVQGSDVHDVGRYLIRVIEELPR